MSILLFSLIVCFSFQFFEMVFFGWHCSIDLTGRVLPNFFFNSLDCIPVLLCFLIRRLRQ